MKLSPENLKCSKLQDKKYRELCSNLSRKDFDKKHYANVAQYFFPELQTYFLPRKVKIDKNGFTNDKNVDMLILNKLDDEDLSKVCLTNKYVYSLCQEENFWMNRFINTYGDSYENIDGMKMFKGEASWKEYYIWVSDLVNDPHPYYIYAQAKKAERMDICGLLIDLKNVYTVTIGIPVGNGMISSAEIKIDPNVDHTDVDPEKVRVFFGLSENIIPGPVELKAFKILNANPDAEYIKTLLIGPFTIIMNNGEIIEGNFCEGGWDHYEGEYKTYYPNKSLKYEAFYINSLKDGEEREFYDNGNVKVFIINKNGEKQEETTYLKNGKIIDATIYKGGKAYKKR